MTRENFRGKRELTNQSSEPSVLTKNICILFSFFHCHGKSPQFLYFELTKGKIFEMHFGYPSFYVLTSIEACCSSMCYFQSIFLDSDIIFKKEFHNGKDLFWLPYLCVFKARACVNRRSKRAKYFLKIITFQPNYQILGLKMSY